MVLSSAKCIIRFSIVILLEIRLQPLAKLKVVLVLGFDKPCYFDVTFNTILVEGILEDFVVLNIFIFVLGIPLHFAELESAGVESVKDSTVDCACGTLLDLCQIQL